MPNPLAGKKMDAVRSSKTPDMLDNIYDSNTAPVEGMKATLEEAKAIAANDSDEPDVDLCGIKHRLNRIPVQLEKLDQRGLESAWDSADKIGRAAAWIKGHVVLTMDRKFKEEAVKRFAEEKGLSERMIYNYMHLAETFPHVDMILEPTFHFKALSISRGDREKAIALIEMAREKKKNDTAYSVRDFMADAGEPRNSKLPQDDPGKFIKHLNALLTELKRLENLDAFKNELAAARNTLDLLLKA